MDLKMLFVCVFHPFLMTVHTESVVPLINVDKKDFNQSNYTNETTDGTLKFLPFIMLIDHDKDTSEYWRETEIISLVRSNEDDIDYERCKMSRRDTTRLRIPSQRTVRPICRSPDDFQQCPQCPRLNNNTECELFRDSCRENRVHPSQYRTYCDSKYGKWKAMFIPADYSQCRCCDECVFYRELDQSCMEDEYLFDADEFMPVTTIDFRAGCNPYWGHPEQESRALHCDPALRRCIPVSIPTLRKDTPTLANWNPRYPPLNDSSCPVSCQGYQCRSKTVKEEQCTPGAFMPEPEQCNCCGTCSSYFQLNQKCAEFQRTVHTYNGTKETEIEEEFIEPGCDDGLVCREGVCQDIHSVSATVTTRHRRDKIVEDAYEPCRRELKYFKRKYGKDGHLHYNAPQCTPLWLYAPVQCRRFVCYCALEDGTIIEGIKVPRIEVSNMNCDCAREKCRTGSEVHCDGYGNYMEATFSPYSLEMRERSSARKALEYGTSEATVRTGYEDGRATTKLI